MDIWTAAKHGRVDILEDIIDELQAAVEKEKAALAVFAIFACVCCVASPLKSCKSCPAVPKRFRDQKDLEMSYSRPKIAQAKYAILKKESVVLYSFLNM